MPGAPAARTATKNANGWQELDQLPPRRTVRRQLNPDAVESAVSIVRRGKVVTDGKTYRSRSAAKWRGTRLAEAMRELRRGLALETRTWQDGSRWRWGIARRKG